MKFRYAGRVQQSLIEHEKILDISSRLTRINCEIEAMRDIAIARKSPDKIKLERMMEDQVMDALRSQKWQAYLGNL